MDNTFTSDLTRSDIDMTWLYCYTGTVYAFLEIFVLLYFGNISI